MQNILTSPDPTVPRRQWTGSAADSELRVFLSLSNQRLAVPVSMVVPAADTGFQQPTLTAPLGAHAAARAIS